jgi:ubiquitin-conjugating enzyme E2 J2
MATQTYAIRLSRDFQSIQKSPIPFVQTHPSPTNILSWPYIITGPEGTPFSSGQYYGNIVFPENFPYAAPSITMSTPSGRFHCDLAICTTFTSMHPEAWNPAWTVESILTGFLSFMTGKEHGHGCIQATDKERVGFARKSKKWNSLECERFRADFPEIHERNVMDENFTEEELKRCTDDQELVTPPAPTTGTGTTGTFLDMSYESHMKEDWDKFGSMEEEDDFDYYDDEEDEEQDEEEYDTSDTEMDDAKEGA